jgi:hypothetical protein
MRGKISKTMIEARVAIVTAVHFHYEQFGFGVKTLFHSYTEMLMCFEANHKSSSRGDDWWYDSSKLKVQSMNTIGIGSRAGHKA